MFAGASKSSKFSFSPLEIKKKKLFLQKLMGKCQISKSWWGLFLHFRSPCSWSFLW